MEKLILMFEPRLKRWGIYIISLPLFVMAVIEALNALGRKLFIPFPCAIEAVESLLVITIYFGVSIVAQERAHVAVDLIVRKFPQVVQNHMETFSNLLGFLTFGLLTYGAWIEAWKAVLIWEMRIGVYRFPLWPFKVLFAVGMSLLTIQLLFNVIKLIYVSLGHTSYADMDKIEEVEISI